MIEHSFFFFVIYFRSSDLLFHELFDSAALLHDVIHISGYITQKTRGLVKIEDLPLTDRTWYGRSYHRAPEAVLVNSRVDCHTYAMLISTALWTRSIMLSTYHGYLTPLVPVNEHVCTLLGVVSLHPPSRDRCGITSEKIPPPSEPHLRRRSLKYPQHSPLRVSTGTAW